MTAVDASGKSYVASDEDVPAQGLLWTADPRDGQAWVDAIDMADVFSPAQPPKRGACWYLSELPPGKGMRDDTASLGAGMDARGFHLTKTVDFIYILRGTVILELDRDTVELSDGDAVVLQAANHAWRNPTSEPVRFLDVMISRE